jgi:hypothetical protein
MKFYDAELEQFVKIMEDRKRIAKLKKQLPIEERWKANPGIGGHSPYDHDEAVRDFDMKMKI